jgi:transposase
MYIERVSNRNSPPAILLRESSRQDGKVRKRTLANLSKWPPELIEQFQQLLKGVRTIDKLEDAFEIVRSEPHGHVRAVLGTLHQIKLHTAIIQRGSRNRDLVQAMAVARILEPTSKLATARGLAPKTCSSSLAQELNLGVVTEVELYQAMDWLLKRQSKIEQKLAQRHLSEDTLVLCDLSSTYLEGQHCPLAKRGHCRDGKKGKVQIEFSLLCNQQGCPVAVTVFEGNTSDPKTLKPQLQKLTERFGIKHGILVGDRGTLPDTQIQQQLKDLAGWDWITALRTAQIRKLLETGTLKLEQFATQSWIEIESETYPNERLIACLNRHRTHQAQHKREALLSATQTELDKIVVAHGRSKQRLEGKAEIGLRVGKVLNRFQVAKHFELSISDTHFSYQRKSHTIEADAQLDGLYVIRTSVSSQKLAATVVVQTYKNLSRVEQAFRCIKTTDLKIRPTFHHVEDRVRAHVFICFLAYYVEWHMRQRLAPILFEEDDPDEAQQLRASIVEPAKRSNSARKKAGSKQTLQGEPVHSFQSLLSDLATIVRSTVQPQQLSVACFEKVTQPTPVQQRAFELLEVPL